MNRMFSGTARVLPKAFAALALAALAALLLATGCSSGNQDAARDSTDNRSMVVSVDGDNLLFVNLTTDTPYIPTLPEGRVFDRNGNVISADQLVPGNIVEVDGDGAMTASMPAQYPGITEVRVVEEGNPEDAAKYNGLVPASDGTNADQPPAATLLYSSDLGEITVILNPYYTQWTTSDGTDVSEEGVFADDNGAAAEAVQEVRVGEPEPMTVNFDLALNDAKVTSVPLVSDDGDVYAVDMSAAPVPVDAMVSAESGNVAFEVSAGSLYIVEGQFPQGTVRVAFMAVA